MGFCFGVKRAVMLTNSALNKNEKHVYSLGSVIHNPQVIEQLKSKGLRVVKDIKDIKAGIFLIRSHGISPKVLQTISKRNLKLIDGTCPFVKRCHDIARQLKSGGFKIIVAGQRHHPEVAALLDVAGKRNCFVVNSIRDAAGLNISKQKVGVIAQTTQNMSDYFDIINILLTKDFRQMRIFNTICLDVRRRQQAAINLAKSVDMVFVVGGKNSANTTRLAKVLRNIKKDVYHIETEGDIKTEWLKNSLKAVGVTSGASTPEWIIDRVINRIKNSSEKNIRERR